MKHRDIKELENRYISVARIIFISQFLAEVNGTGSIVRKKIAIIAENDFMTSLSLFSQGSSS